MLKVNPLENTILVALGGLPVQVSPAQRDAATFGEQCYFLLFMVLNFVIHDKCANL